jgi:hypothetical protein
MNRLKLFVAEAILFTQFLNKSCNQEHKNRISYGIWASHWDFLSHSEKSSFVLGHAFLGWKIGSDCCASIFAEGRDTSGPREAERSKVKANFSKGMLLGGGT